MPRVLVLFAHPAPELERILLADLAAPPQDRDAGWDPESLREEYRDA